MKRSLLFILTLLPFSFVLAQSLGRLVVKLSDGTTHDLDRTAAFIAPDRSLSIYAHSKGDIKHTFQVRIKPTANDMKSVIKGKYLFHENTRLLDYVPGGPSSNYKVDGYYSQQTKGQITQEWIAENGSEYGYIEIESITAERVKGKFYCELVQQLPVKGTKKKMEGTFDVAIMKSDANSKPTIAPANPSTSSTAARPASRAYKFSERQPIIGLYDLQLAGSVITTGDMGLDVDFGATLVNIPYGKNNDASATIALHYDYSRQKYDLTMSDLNFRRNHLYARLRPFTSRPNGETYTEYVLGLFVAGIYADLGYTKGYYYNTNINDQKISPDYNADGLFWGMGWNLIWRKENRWGANIGFGSKRYTITLPNGNESKYRTRLITLGVVYNLKWRD